MNNPPYFPRSPIISSFIQLVKKTPLVFTSFWLLIMASTFVAHANTKVPQQPNTCDISLVQQSQTCPGDLNCITDYAPDGFAFYLGFQNPADGTPLYRFQPGTGQFEAYPNGTAHITGIIVNTTDANKKWQLDVWLDNLLPWGAWDALSNETTYYEDPSIPYGIDLNYLNWDYYHLSSASVLTGVPGSYWAGAVIHLEAYHYNMYAFQVGVGANAKDLDYGGASWFSFNGTRADGSWFGTESLNGDINFDFCNTICNGSATFQVNTNSSFTYNITPSVQAYANGNTISIYDACPNTYTLTINTADGCTATTSFTFNVPQNSISLTLPGSVSGCSSATINAGAGYASYQWSNGASTSSINVTQSGTYTVTVTDANGCSGTAQTYANIGAGSIAQPNLGDNVSTCANNYTLNAGAGYSSYQWSTGATWQNITVNQSGTYTVTVTNASGCTATDAVYVSLGSNISLNLGNDVSTCSNSYNINAGAGYSSYQWSNGATTSNINVTQSGNYSVTVTNASGCTATDVVYVGLGSGGTSLNLGNDVSTCSNSYTINAGAANGYQWSTGANSSTIIVTQNGTYTVTVTYSGGCTATDAINVTLGTGGATISLGNDVNTCNSNYTLNAGTGYTNYQWSNGATTSNINVTQSGTYTVTVTTANGCTATDAINVTLGTGGTNVDLGDAIINLCNDNSYYLSPTNGVSYAAVVWSTWATSYGISVNQSGTYTVTVTDANGCTSSDSAEIIFQDFTINLGDVTQVVCDSITLGLPIPEGLNYQWSTGATTHYIDLYESGTYSLTVTDAGGCTASDVINLNIQHPSPNLGNDTIVVGGLVLDAENVWGYSYQWSTGENTPSISVTQSGTYSVTVTTEVGCVGYDEITVTVISGLAPNTILGLAYVDWNNNHLHDWGETVLPNILVRLVRAIDNTTVATSYSNNQGYYVFNNIPFGRYKLLFKRPQAFSLTTLQTPLLRSNQTGDAVGMLVEHKGSTRCDAAFVPNQQPTTFVHLPNNVMMAQSSSTGPVVFAPKYACGNDFTLQTICLPATDEDGEDVIISQISSSAGNTATIFGGNCIHYTAALNFNGMDTLTVTACNEGNPESCGNSLVYVSVPCPAPPTVENDTVSTTINQNILIGVLNNDNDNYPSVIVSGQPTNGTAIVQENDVLYTPNNGFIGTEVFSYQVTDLYNQIAFGTIVVHVLAVDTCQQTLNYCAQPYTPIQLCPVFCTVSNATITDIHVTFNCSINQQDDNCFEYVALPAFVGTDTVLVTACNDIGECETLTLLINVQCSQPTANNDSFMAELGTPNTFSILGNDTQECDSPLSPTLLTEGTFGDAFIDSNGNLVYVPNATAANQTDTLYYAVCNSCPAALCDTAMVVIAITGEITDIAPNAHLDALVIQSGDTVYINALANDEGSDISITNYTQPNLGTVAFDTTTNTFSYTADPNFTGNLFFTYTICNSIGCDTAAVVISIQSHGVANQAPVAQDDSFSTNNATSITLNVLNNDYDADGGDIVLTEINQFPENGTVTIDNGVITYLPDTNFVGVDTIQYTICDTDVPVLCDLATVIIFVTDTTIISQTVTAIADTATTTLGTSVTIPLLANDLGDDISITDVSNPLYGSFVVDANNNLVYTPSPNLTIAITDQFTYTICNPSSECDSATVTIFITAPTDTVLTAVDDDKYGT
ncbi:MAG: cadherin-like domain-containing protein [Sphingobacteriales bacterium]|nr:cadherin-like domain-containing protein [Sphingobacteriales bacterium]